MDTRGQISVTVLIQFLFVGDVLLSGGAGLQYVGCYHLLGLPRAEHPALKLKVHTCVLHCSELNISHAAYKTPLCHCVFNLTRLRTVDHDSCTFSCVEDSSLRCGGMTAVSLYSTDLPQVSTTMAPITSSTSDLSWMVSVALVLLLMAIMATSYISWWG